MTTSTVRSAPSVAAPARRYRWWHAAAVGLAANAVSALPRGFNGDAATATAARNRDEFLGRTQRR